MLISFHKQSKSGLVLGIISGVAGFFLFEQLIFSTVLGTFTAALVGKQEDWITNTKYTALVGAVLAGIYVIFFEITKGDDLANISFPLLDHMFYLLIFGGISCALVGAVVGAVTTGIRLLFS